MTFVRGLLTARWPDARVHLFGSAANQLCIHRTNDIDVCLEVGAMRTARRACLGLETCMQAYLPWQRGRCASRIEALLGACMGACGRVLMTRLLRPVYVHGLWQDQLAQQLSELGCAADPWGVCVATGGERGAGRPRDQGHAGGGDGEAAGGGGHAQGASRQATPALVGYLFAAVPNASDMRPTACLSLPHLASTSGRKRKPWP